MEMMYYQLAKYSYEDSLKVLEGDIQHANVLAASIPRAKGGAHIQMQPTQIEAVFLHEIQRCGA